MNKEVHNLISLIGGRFAPQFSRWIRAVVVTIFACCFAACMNLTFSASKRLQIGWATLPQPVFVAWLTEALPFLLAVGFVLGLAYLLPYVGSRRSQIGIVAFIALVVSSWLAFQPVSYSMDILRYLWDGHLLKQGISPYSYVPADPHLVPLRDWPYWDSLAWKQWPEAYPTVAQAYFWLVAWVSNGRPTAFKLLLALNGMVSGALFLRVLVVKRHLQVRKQMKTERAKTVERWSNLTVADIRAFVLFALFPPMLLEAYGAGHVDALAVPWLLFAWLAALRRQPVRLGIAIALATGIKLYPVVLFAAFWNLRNLRFIIISLVSFAVTVFLTLLPVLGNLHAFISYYTKLSNMAYNGSLEPILVHWFGSTIAAHSTWLVMASEAIIWSLVLFTRIGQLSLERKACLLGLTFFLASPLVHPWYLISLLPFAAVGVDWATLWLAVSSHLTYDEVFLDMYIEYVPTYFFYLATIFSRRYSNGTKRP